MGKVHELDEALQSVEAELHASLAREEELLARLPHSNKESGVQTCDKFERRVIFDSASPSPTSPCFPSETLQTAAPPPRHHRERRPTSQVNGPAVCEVDAGNQWPACFTRRWQSKSVRSRSNSGSRVTSLNTSGIRALSLPPPQPCTDS